MAGHNLHGTDTSEESAVMKQDTDEDGASTEETSIKMRIEMFETMINDQSDETPLKKPTINTLQHVTPPSTHLVDTVSGGACQTGSSQEVASRQAPIQRQTNTANGNAVTSEVSPVVIGKDTESDENVYRMDRADRGVFVIINNRHFHPSTRSKERSGTDFDAARLYELFMRLGFEVRLENNKTKTEMLMILHKAAKEDHTNRDCFMCAILTHGDVDRVYGTDGAISIDTLVSPFKGQQCSTLRGKPKVFIIQACRGTMLDHGVEVADGKYEPEQKIYRIPQEADFLYCYSTAPDYVSWRDENNGSWFIYALCRVFLNDSSRLEIMAMLTKVSRLVAYAHESKTVCKDMAHKKQIPSIVSMLTKLLYLSPK